MIAHIEVELTTKEIVVGGSIVTENSAQTTYILQQVRSYLSFPIVTIRTASGDWTFIPHHQIVALMFIVDEPDEDDEVTENDLPNYPMEGD